MIQRTLVLFMVLFLNYWGQAQIIDRDKEKEIKIFVKGFLGLLSKYSNCKGDGYLSLQAQIIDMHDSYDTRDIMYNDLFFENNSFSENEKVYNWQQYLDKMKYSFNNSIEVEYDYDNMTVLPNCIVSDPVTNNRYTYVTVKKTLSYEQQKKSYTCLLSINLSNGNKIAEVSTPSLYLGTCDLVDRGKENNEKTKNMLLLRSLADDYFSKKDYILAKSYYKSLLVEDPSNSEITNKISECDQMITTAVLLKRAQEFFNDKKFNDAKLVYDTLLTPSNIDNSFIRSQVKLCMDSITERAYLKNKEIADYYYSISKFDISIQYYRKSLELKNGDSYALAQIEKAKKRDYNFVLAEIQRAEDLAKRKKYAEAFKVLSDYELSGLLKTDNYYFLTAMMFRGKADVKRLMHYSTEDCETYLCIYVLKLKKKLETETNQGAIDDSIFLIDEVINKRFQKLR